MSVKETMNLHQIQCQMAQAIMRPLVEGRISRQWLDGSDANKFADQFIKPNKDLNSLERLEIYNEQYWIRLIESLQDDFPGLQSVLGDERFEQLLVAYLTNYPSQSYSLNHLGWQLPKFILEKPELTHPHSQLAYEMTSFEWAEIAAYDAQSKLCLEPGHLRDKDPARIMLQLQPHITILELNYALDDFLLKLNKPVDKSVESNAFIARTKKSTKISMPIKKHIFVAVYRLDDIVYYKRINNDQYVLLKALEEGKPLAEACNNLITGKDKSRDGQALAKKINQYFIEWTQLNWFCYDAKKESAC